MCGIIGHVFHHDASFPSYVPFRKEGREVKEGRKKGR
jgi:hypothetical protein